MVRYTKVHRTNASKNVTFTVLKFNILNSYYLIVYSDRTEESFTTNSIPSIIMIVINYGYDSVFNVQLIECLLSLKRNLIQV